MLHNIPIEFIAPREHSHNPGFIALVGDFDAICGIQCEATMEAPISKGEHHRCFEKNLDISVTYCECSASKCNKELAYYNNDADLLVNDGLICIDCFNSESEF